MGEAVPPWIWQDTWRRREIYCTRSPEKLRVSSSKAPSLIMCWYLWKLSRPSWVCHFESQVERRYVSQYYYTPATKPTPWHEVRREIKSLWDVLKEKRAFTPTGGRAELFPYLSWDDFVNTVFLKTGFYVEDLSPSLTKEVWGTAQNGQTRNQRLRRMVLNYGKKVQGVCITCKQKCCRNMLAEHLTFLHGSHKPNSGKETNPSNLHNERNYDDWEEEFEKLWGYECNQCHGGD